MNKTFHVLFPWVSGLEKEDHRGRMSCLSCYCYFSGHKTKTKYNSKYRGKLYLTCGFQSMRQSSHHGSQEMGREMLALVGFVFSLLLLYQDIQAMGWHPTLRAVLPHLIFSKLPCIHSYIHMCFTDLLGLFYKANIIQI